MPRVPTYDGPQVREAPTPNVQLDARAFQGKARTAAGLADLANAGADAYAKVQQRDDNEAAFKAEAAATADWMQHDADLRKRYRGGNVDGYQEEVEKWWANAPGKYGGALSPRAQQIAGRSLTVKSLQAKGGALAYYSAEKERATVEAFEAKKISTTQMALTDGRPEAVLTARKDLQAGNALEAARRGYTAEQLAAINLRDTTTLHSEYISRLSQGNAGAAKAYFEKFKDEIDATRHDTLGNVLKAEGDNQAARKNAADWAALPVEEQLKKAGAIDDGELRDKTLLAVKHNIGLVKEAQAQAEQRASDTAWQHFAKTGRLPAEAVLAQMHGRERDQLQETRRQRIEHMAAGGTAKSVKTDPATLAKLLDLQASDPQEFAKTFRAEAYAYKIAGSDLEQLSNKRAAILNPAKERDLVALNAKITSRLEELGIATGTTHQVKRGQYRAAAQREIEAAQARTGKPPTPTEEDEILDRLTIQGEVVNRWWNDDRMVYEVPPGDLPRFRPKAGEDEARVAPLRIPKGERDSIIATLRRKGVAVNDENILLMFNAAQKGQKK